MSLALTLTRAFAQLTFSLLHLHRKVNPTQSEAMTMVVAQVMGNNVAVCASVLMLWLVD